MSKAPDDRPQRADAQRNREKLLSAAVEAFSHAGVDIPLEGIARKAGVGIGTLYRHFPTRDALVEAAYRREVEQLCGAAAELLRGHPPDLALRAWMERFLVYVAAKKGMAEALKSVVASNSQLYAGTYGQIFAALSSLLQAAMAAGTVRPDANTEDVLRAMSGVWLVTSEADWQAKAHRLLDLLMDGLRYGAPNPPS